MLLIYSSREERKLRDSTEGSSPRQPVQREWKQCAEQSRADAVSLWMGQAPPFYEAGGEGAQLSIALLSPLPRAHGPSSHSQTMACPVWLIQCLNFVSNF